jgi:hypothetical protein
MKIASDTSMKNMLNLGVGVFWLIILAALSLAAIMGCVLMLYELWAVMPWNEGIERWHRLSCKPA